MDGETIGLNTEGYWDGALWVYQADITNGAGGAGVHTYTVSLAVGSEYEILYGQIFNGDTVGVLMTVTIDDGTASQELAQLLSVTADANTRHSFPHSDVAAAAGTHLSAGSRIILAGGLRLRAATASVAASQNTAFSLVCRIRGAVPTVVEVGASTPTININTEQVF